MKITDIQLGMISIPLKTPFKTALRRVDTAQDLIVKVVTDDSAVGYGNAPATVVITGDSHESVAAAIIKLEPFKIHILGCGSALPTLKHNASSQLIEMR